MWIIPYNSWNNTWNEVTSKETCWYWPIVFRKLLHNRFFPVKKHLQILVLWNLEKLILYELSRHATKENTCHYKGPSQQILVHRTCRGWPSLTSPKDPVWPSRGRLDLASWGCLNLTSWECLNLTFKGRPQDVPRGLQAWMSQFFLTFLSELFRLTKSI